MCCPVNTSDKVVFGVTAFLAVSAITLLIVGILANAGSVPIAPIGARVMIGLGVGIILAMIGGAVKTCCSD